MSARAADTGSIFHDKVHGMAFHRSTCTRALELIPIWTEPKTPLSPVGVDVRWMLDVGKGGSQ